MNTIKQQQPVKIWYNGVEVGDYIADLIVEDSVLIEVKTVEYLGNTQTAQCLNYLKATGMRIGLLMNFETPRVEIKRVIL